MLERLIVQGGAVVAALGAWAAGRALLGEPSGVDVPFLPFHTIGVGLIFFAWLLCVVESGGFWIDRLGWRLSREENLIFCAALGMLWFAALAGLLGHLGLLSVERSEIFMSLAFALPVVRGLFRGRPTSARENIEVPNGAYEPLSVLAGIVWFALFAVLFLYAASPRILSDSMIYHLTAPRVWAQHGRIEIVPRMPTLFSASYWEYLLIWAHAWLGGPGDQGLVAAHIFAQWCEVMLGFGGSVLAVRVILKTFSGSRAWCTLAVLVASSAPSTRFLMSGGKSDWAATFWTLSGVALIVGDRPAKSRWWVAGLLFGAAVGAKYTAALAAVPLVMACLAAPVPGLGRRVAFGRLAAGGLIAILPVFVRNYLGSGNPFFPVLFNVFPSPWRAISQLLYGVAIENRGLAISGVEAIRQRLAYLLTGEPAMFLPVLVWGRLRAREVATARNLWLASMAGYVLILATVGLPRVNAPTGGDPTLLLRLAGAASVVGQALGVWLLGHGLISYGLGKAAQNGLILFGIIAAGFSSARFPTAYFFAWRETYDHEQIMAYRLRNLAPAGYAKAWLRAHARFDELIVTTGDAQLYYLSHLKAAAASHVPVLDSLMWRDQTGGDFEPRFSEDLYRTGATWLLDTIHFNTMSEAPADLRLRDTTLSRLLQDTEWRHPSAIRYLSPDATVFDVREWAWDIAQACVAYRPLPGVGGIQAALLLR